MSLGLFEEKLEENWCMGSIDGNQFRFLRMYESVRAYNCGCNLRLQRTEICRETSRHMQ